MSFYERFQEERVEPVDSDTNIHSEQHVEKEVKAIIHNVDDLNAADSNWLKTTSVLHAVM